MNKGFRTPGLVRRDEAAEGGFHGGTRIGGRNLRMVRNTSSVEYPLGVQEEEEEKESEELTGRRREREDRGRGSKAALWPRKQQGFHCDLWLRFARRSFPRARVPQNVYTWSDKSNVPERHPRAFASYKLTFTSGETRESPKEKSSTCMRDGEK